MVGIGIDDFMSDIDLMEFIHSTEKYSVVFSIFTIVFGRKDPYVCDFPLSAASRGLLRRGL